jgi:hypothetical protein
VGWALAARLLDGVVAAAVAGCVLAAGRFTPRGKLRARALPWIVLGALPFVALLAADQRAATGSAWRPTQAEFFARSDFPPRCHRLGFGRDVGCMIEHPGERRAFGPDGYTPDDAARVMRQRAGALGRDLLGVGPMLLLALLAVVARPTAPALLCAGFALALCLAYGLFYYGNAPLFGARHLFPAAPFLWALAAWALAGAPRRRGAAAGAFLDERHARGVALLAVMAAGAGAGLRVFRADGAQARAWQTPRLDARAFAARHGIARGIVVTNDRLAAIAAMDPYADGARRFFVPRMGSYLNELRARHPELPVHLALPGGRDTVLALPPVRPGLLVELEAEWPSFQRPRGAGATAVSAALCCRAPASDGQVLQAFLAAPGATLALPFDVARGGTYALRLAALAGPTQGDWRVAVDGVALPSLRGYAPVFVPRSTDASAPMALAAGRHMLVLSFLGRDPRSRGSGGTFDALEGEAVADGDARP